MDRILVLLATFLSALLLFVVQPLYAKYLLPFFGGTSSVWTISVFFYSTTLLLGYLYAALLWTWPRRWSRIIHTGLLALTALLLLVRWMVDASPLLLPTVEVSSPAFSVLLTLLMAVGLPVLLLASTSIITQHLYACITGKEPYALYGLSNAGSLLGLAAYPFFIELFTPLDFQSSWWTIGFFVFIAVLSAAWWRIDSDKEVVEVMPLGVNKEKAAMPRLQIILLAAVPTFFLAACTEYIGKGIASFPMIWVVPLMLYLASFIFTFKEQLFRWWRVGFGFAAFMWAMAGLFVLPLITAGPALDFWFGFIVLVLAFFQICLYFHRRVYELRPVVADLGPFYVYVTIGGALGSGLVGLVLPLILNSQIELFVGFSVLVAYLAFKHLSWMARYIPARVVRVAQVMVLLMVVLFLYDKVWDQPTITKERNFYGSLFVDDVPMRVYEEVLPVRRILNGSIKHGMQVLDERYEAEAASYYGPDSGIDIAIRRSVDAGVTPRINVIGLGAGMMNAYCDDLEVIEYIEINPQVVSVAEEYFTYLDLCPDKTSIAIGDGRLVLEQLAAEQADPYDVIMVDAFTDDAIPTHLITIDAFREAYRPVLAEGGILAFHISNRYLNLRPVLVGLAEEAGLEATLVDTRPDGTNELFQVTTWVLISDAETAAVLQTYPNTSQYEGETVFWTDNRNSVLDVLSLIGSY